MTIRPIHSLRLSSPATIEVEGKTYRCTIGRGGIAAVGQKREGDLMTPSGNLAMRGCYRPDRIAPPVTGLPLTALTPADGWCDDAAHPLYNQPVKLPFDGRHEKLWREDGIYDLIVPLGYNDSPVVAGLGSAIFLHLMREDGIGTEGCIAMQRQVLLELLPRFTAETAIQVG